LIVPVPNMPKLYHIVHVDRLASIIADKRLWCDARMMQRMSGGTTIGMGSIKQRRLCLPISSHPGLMVGGCVPFYFCPRSVMLYVIERANDEGLTYRGGQGPIVHLEYDLSSVVEWAKKMNRRWAFTLSNAGAKYFEDRSDLAQMNEINWAAVHAKFWAGGGISQSIKEGKQAEFLVEESVPWSLVKRVGVQNQATGQLAAAAVDAARHRPTVEIIREWYY
jgi:hypothetical protein